MTTPRPTFFRRHVIAASAALALFAGTAMAQDASMERIVAVVGREIILKSDIDGQIELLAQRNPSVNRTDPALRRQILDLLINERLIVTKAMEDSVQVTDDEISQRMEMQLQMLVQQFGSEQRIEAVYGMSMARIRREFRDEMRKQILAGRMRELKFANVKASRADVEDFYKRFHDSLQLVPARIDLYHLARNIKPSDQQRKEAFDMALRVRDSIMKGASFGDFARRYSADPGSAANGGDLGYSERGKFVPAFEAAAFALQPNEISQPVETPFGYHVIQLIDKTATTINCRHILFRVGQSEADRDAVRTELLAIKARVEAGEDFELLARELSDDKATQGLGGSMGQMELSRLPEDLKNTLMALKDGGVTEPLPYTADPTKPGYHIMMRKQVIAEHAPTLQTDYKLLEQMAALEKRQRQEQVWLAELRKTLYWEYRD